MTARPRASTSTGRGSEHRVHRQRRRLEHWRIGAYGSPAGGFFDGLIDNVRIYGRALSASEIQTDMASRIQPDRTPPTVTAITPGRRRARSQAGSSVTATFSEPMKSSSPNASTFQLKDPAGNSVPATVSYDATTQTATLTPQAALAVRRDVHGRRQGRTAA